MDIEKTTILLEKINNLHHNIQKDADNISSIERDLLKDYIKSLYEALLETDDSQKDMTSFTKVKSKQKSTEHEELPGSSGPVHEELEVEAEEIEPVIEKETIKYQAPRIIQVPEDIKEEIASTPPKETSEIRHEAPASVVTDEIEALFEEDNSGNDLSSRLANAPIRDLSKAVSINERIFTVNELFGGNTQAFDGALKLLNSYGSFKEAKFNVLADLAIEYAWADKKRVKKAKNFIRLVKRRYL